MLKKGNQTKTSTAELENIRSTPHLRDHHELMAPEEMTTEERWNRIIELLALMTAADAAGEPVLMSKSDS